MCRRAIHNPCCGERKCIELCLAAGARPTFIQIAAGRNHPIAVFSGHVCIVECADTGRVVCGPDDSDDTGRDECCAGRRRSLESSEGLWDLHHRRSVACRISIRGGKYLRCSNIHDRWLNISAITAAGCRTCSRRTVIFPQNATGVVPKDQLSGRIRSDPAHFFIGRCNDWCQGCSRIRARRKARHARMDLIKIPTVVTDPASVGTIINEGFGSAGVVL